jgi:hypothetical protein
MNKFSLIRLVFREMAQVIPIPHYYVRLEELHSMI